MESRRCATALRVDLQEYTGSQVCNCLARPSTLQDLLVQLFSSKDKGATGRFQGNVPVEPVSTDLLALHRLPVPGAWVRIQKRLT